MGCRIRTLEQEKEIATPRGPKGNPAMEETTARVETIELASKKSLPRPWLAKSQLETLATGLKSAQTAKAAKIAADCSHFGPRITSVIGRARAKSKPPRKKPPRATV